LIKQAPVNFSGSIGQSRGDPELSRGVPAASPAIRYQKIVVDIFRFLVYPIKADFA
jgi:hypothetical protein